MINSPSKQYPKKFDSIMKNFEFSSLKKEFNFNFSSPSIQLLQSSNKKFFYGQENLHNNVEVNGLKGEKSIKQNLENEFDNIKSKEESFPIVFTVNSEFLDVLSNIYFNNDIINYDYDNKTKEKENDIIIAKKNISDNNVFEIKEQITCICLKSNCNNNYCSCHKNKNFCNNNCRCLNCKNKNEKENNITKNNENKYMTKK